MSRRALAVRLAASALLAGVLAAIGWQELGRALPLGLWNEGEAIARKLSLACAALAALLLALFALELLRRRPVPGSGALLSLLVAALLLEGLVSLLDVTLVSRGAAQLGGPYREVPGPDGGYVTLKKPHLGSPFGFRTEEPYPLATEHPRLLFLGDSYTEGSGRSKACNYPEVAGATLSASLRRPVEVMNAGVAGYGPADALELLRLLVAEGYRFDVLIYGLFLENDFTDNLPGTQRRVVAGIPFRFPESPFLRAFHPLNSRSFRYAVFVERSSRFVRHPGTFVRRDPGPCDLTPRSLERLSPELEDLVLRRLEANYAPGAAVAKQVVAESVEAMRRIAVEQRADFVLVIFPDRILVDHELRELLARDPEAEGYAMERLRAFALERFAGMPVIDITRTLRDGSENFRPDDTHLSDLGNLRAGQRVGRTLAQILPRRGFPMAAPAPHATEERASGSPEI